MHDDRSFLRGAPIYVSGPTRFALVGPGHPLPEVIIASTEQLSDLLGFYSLEEAGLDRLFERYKSVPSPVFDIFGTTSDRRAPPYAALSANIVGKNSKKEKYSLIIETKGQHESVGWLLDEYNEELSKEIREIVKAYRIGTPEQVVYGANLLNMFIQSVIEKSSYERNRWEKKRRFVQASFVIYIGLGLAALATLGIFQLFKPS